MLDVKPFSPRDRRFRELATRSDDADAEKTAYAAEVLKTVREEGCPGLLRFVNMFDSPLITGETLRVPEAELSAARKEVSERFLTSLSLARVNTRKFHEDQRRTGYIYDDSDGVRLTRSVRALRRVGICVGDSLSTLLMHAVPAQLAGVRELVAAVSTRADGSVDPKILAAAKVLDIGEVYRMSGAHAVAALACGAGPIARVDKIVGSGGAALRAAKRLVSGSVGVDAGLGLDELVIIADESANAKFIAVDLLAQAEHGGKSGLSVLFTTDRLLAEAVRIEMDRLIDLLPDPPTMRKTLDASGALFVCPDLDTAIDAANILAPARLSLMTAYNEQCLVEVETAGAVFIGPWSMEAAGDSFAGINPFLPMAGRSRFASGLGVDDFVREMPVIEYGPDRLLRTGRHIATLADEDGMPAHAAAVRERLELLKLAVD